jgi:hypothetical protein
LAQFVGKTEFSDMSRILAVAPGEAGRQPDSDRTTLAAPSGFGKTEPGQSGSGGRSVPGRSGLRGTRSPCLYGFARYNRVSPHMGSTGCFSNIPTQETPVKIRRLPRLLALSASVLATVMPPSAYGQEPDPNVPVTGRPRPDFDPLGIRAGGFLIYPHTSVESTYNSNVFATKDDEKDDFIFNFLPGFVVRSNFPRHAIVWTTEADIARYVSETDENYEDFGTALNGRLDITRNNRLTGGLDFAREHESRDDPEDPGAEVQDEPLKYYEYGADAGFQQEFNRLNFSLRGTADRRDYTDGDEGDRDRNLFGGRVRTGYFISPRINAFLQGGFRREIRDDQDTNRDNNVYSAGVGTEIDFTGLLFGEVFGGWSLQEFDDNQFDSENGFTYGANLTWNPTQLTSVRLNGEGGFEPSDVGSSRLESEIGLRVDHELLRNLLIGGEVRYRRDDFQDTNRVDNRIDVGPDITYFLNRNLSVGAGYTFTTRNSDDSEREFDRNLVTLRVTAQL